MLYKEFEEKRNKIKDEILEKEKELKALEENYINECTAGLIGKKVRCYRKDWVMATHEQIWKNIGIGYVAGGELHYGGFMFKINKVKKDGTMSGQSTGWWNIEKVELIEE